MRRFYRKIDAFNPPFVSFINVSVGKYFPVFLHIYELWIFIILKIFGLVPQK